MSRYNWTKIEKLDQQPKQFCKGCKSFRRHYIKDIKGSYCALSYGHCIKAPRDRRLEYDPACGGWKPKEG